MDVGTAEGITVADCSGLAGTRVTVGEGAGATAQAETSQVESKNVNTNLNTAIFEVIGVSIVTYLSRDRIFGCIIPQRQPDSFPSSVCGAAAQEA